MLGVTVQRDARHAIKRCLFGHIARIGNDTLGISREIAELQIRKRLYHMHIGCTAQLFQALVNGLGCRSAQGSNHGHMHRCRCNLPNHSQKIGRVGDENLTVKRENEILAIVQLQVGEQRRAHQPIMIKAHGVHQDVAHHIYFR